MISDPIQPRWHRLPLLRCTLVALASLVMLSCYHRTEIKPTELPELSDSFAAPVGGGTGVVAVSVAHVEKPDGTLAEIRGEFDVLVRLDSGAELEFTHPVRARLTSSAMVLAVAGGNRPERRIPLERIASVEVSQFDELGASIIGGLVGAGVVVLVVGLSQ
jgi:hypothetical protein